MPAGDAYRSELTETQIIGQVRAGDRAAFEQLFRSYWNKLYQFAFAYLHSREAAEDVVSEMFLRLWSSRSGFNPSGSLEAYLYKAVRNNVNQHIRNDKRLENRHERAMLLGDDVPGMAGHTEDVEEAVFGGDDLKAALWQAISQMPPQRRLIMVLRWQQRKSFAEIAEYLGMSRPAVQMQVDRAIKALRKILG